MFTAHGQGSVVPFFIRPVSVLVKARSMSTGTPVPFAAACAALSQTSASRLITFLSGEAWRDPVANPKDATAMTMRATRLHMSIDGGICRHRPGFSDDSCFRDREGFVR